MLYFAAAIAFTYSEYGIQRVTERSEGARRGGRSRPGERIRRGNEGGRTREREREIEARREPRRGRAGGHCFWRLVASCVALKLCGTELDLRPYPHLCSLPAPHLLLAPCHAIIIVFQSSLTSVVSRFALSIQLSKAATHQPPRAPLTPDQIRYRRSKYFLVLVIGTYCAGIGLALRISFRNGVHSLGGYIAMYMFVVLSPCAFLAADYILLGRIVQYLHGEKYLLLPPGKVSWFFVISDSEYTSSFTSTLLSYSDRSQILVWSRAASALLSRGF